MAKGYPTRARDDTPRLGGVLPEQLCIVCKRREARAGGFCETCATELQKSSEGP